MSISLRAFRTASRALPRASTKLLATRAFSSSLKRSADDHGHAAPPQLYGPGGKAGEIPSNDDQATGLERFELMGDLLGFDVFDRKPLQMTRVGTMDDPIKIFSLAPERIVGCTGFPADSHDTLWMKLNMRLTKHRCNECGCVYSLDFRGDPHQLLDLDQEPKGPAAEFPIHPRYEHLYRSKEEIRQIGLDMIKAEHGEHGEGDHSSHGHH